ncbi:MAG: lysylphosphatidylglycerol synthase domain-containing protein [Alphaproteobacteria bacterium]
MSDDDVNVSRAPGARLRMLVPLVMTLIAFGLLAFFIDVPRLLSILGAAQFGFLPLIALVAATMIALTTIRINLIFEQISGGRMAVAFLLRLNFFTAIVGYMVPIAVMADGVRAAVLWAEMKISPSRAVELSLQDRVIALLGFIFFGAILVLFQDADAPEYLFTQAVFYWGSLVALFIGTISISAFHNRVPWPWVVRINELVQRLVGNIVRPRYLVRQVILAAMSVMLYGAMLWLALQALGITQSPYWALVAVAPSLSIAQNIPVFYLGWGSREAVAVVLLTSVGNIDPSQAVAASLLVGAGVFLGSLPGLLFFARFARMRRSI